MSRRIVASPTPSASIRRALAGDPDARIAAGNNLMTNAIVLRNLTKTFGEKLAVDNLDLEVPQGSLCGFIGPNGAGKTTTIRMILSILFPDSGELTILGRRSAIESKDRIGYLPEERGIYRKMKVSAFLTFMARIKGVPDSEIAARIRGWLERLDLGDARNKRCEELSKGMQQKVQLIAAVIPDPDLLVLDEPFSGLDPVSTRTLREVIQELHARGKTIVFSTHVMQQAEQLCDQVVMIHRGRKVLDSRVAEIRRRYDPHTLLVETAQGGPGIDSIGRLAGVRGVRALDGLIEVDLDGRLPAHAVIASIAAACPVERIELRRPSLEDVFVSIVHDSADGDREDLRHAVRDAASGPVGDGAA